MKLTGRLTMLVGHEGTTIEIADDSSGATFVELKLTNDQLAAILSRQGMVKCDMVVVNTDKIGKRLEVSNICFKIDPDLANSKHADKLHEIATGLLTDGWMADKYFASQTSFTKQDGIQYAACTIRRWVETDK